VIALAPPTAPIATVLAFLKVTTVIDRHTTVCAGRYYASVREYDGATAVQSSEVPVGVDALRNSG